MRLDHIAYRVKNKEKTAKFFIDFMGYKKPENLQEGFDIQFEDGTWAKCLVLEPSEKISTLMPWRVFDLTALESREHHLAPEIFISDGSPGSIVEKWVDAKNGIGGIHHIAYQVDSVEKLMQEWKDRGFSDQFSGTNTQRHLLLGPCTSARSGSLRRNIPSIVPTRSEL